MNNIINFFASFGVIGIIIVICLMIVCAIILPPFTFQYSIEYWIPTLSDIEYGSFEVPWYACVAGYFPVLIPFEYVGAISGYIHKNFINKETRKIKEIKN